MKTDINVEDKKTTEKNVITNTTLVLFQLHWVHEVNEGHICYTPLKGANVLSPVQSSWHLEADAQHCHYVRYAVKP
jgi:hypothetical protein